MIYSIPPRKVGESIEFIELFQKEHKLKNINFFIINDKMRNIDSDFNEFNNIEDVYLFRDDIAYRLIPLSLDRETLNAMIYGNAIGISDKVLDSPELELLIIKEITWFMYIYNITLINPTDPYSINSNLKSKNINIEIKYEKLVHEYNKNIKIYDKNIKLRRMV